MNTELYILIIEDSEDDTFLVVNQIKKGNYNIVYERVETAEDMKLSLVENNWDIILSDYQMPHFSGLEALEILKESGLELPFIIISGAIGEEVAVQAMKAGAHDYIMKSNLKRLLPAIERELQEFQIRKDRKLFEEKQKEAEERYRLIAENTADTITILDLDLNIIYISPSIQKLLGYTVHESLSQTLEQYLTPKSIIEVKNVLAEQIKLENTVGADPSRSVLLELEESHKSGKIIPVEISATFIRDANLAPTSILVVSRDISERKQAEEKVKKLSHAIEQNPVMILITDIEGNIEYVNPKFEEVTGIPREEAIGMKPDIIKSEKTPEEIYNDMQHTIKSFGTWHGELINKKRNGELYWVNTSISPIADNDGNVTHFVGVQEDITEKKKIEEELIMAKERAEESDRLKTAFLQNISHEIRTPLTAIMGFTDLMVSAYYDKTKINNYARIVNTNCFNLLEIIDSILNVAKIESQKISVKNLECNIKKLFDELTLFYMESKLQETKKNIEFSLAISDATLDLIIWTDLAKLRYIFINLINNAFKFTDSGKISGGCKFDRDGNLVFFISDTGIGIPKDKHDLIFERFIKLNQYKDKFMEGTGIGLTIAKGLIDLLGGKIWLESELNKGSTFYFTLPCEIIRK